MERKEMYLWLTMVKSAKEGDEEAQQMLEAENALRAQAGRMSVEQELQMMVEEAAISAEVEKAKQRLRKQMAQK